MGNKVQSINGNPIAIAEKPDMQLVGAIKELLAEAECGHVCQIHIIAMRVDGGVLRIVEGHGDVHRLTGAAAWALHRLCESTDAQIINLQP